MIALGISFSIFLLIGVPIAFSLGLAGAVGLIAMDLKLVTVPARMFTGIDSFVLLAAPFYIFCGDVMNRGGITERLIRFAALVTGRFRGGTAYANVFTSILFAGISGTAIADTAALGQVFIQGMPKEGYSKEYSAAVTIASSIIGPIIPPSVLMVIYAAVTQISVIDLFLSGVVPGLLLGVAVMVVIAMDAKKGALPKSSITVERNEIGRLTLDTLLVVSLPAFIVLGTLSGAFTATEAGGIAAIYAIFLGWVVFKVLNARDLWQALIASARTTATLFLIVAAATVTSYVLAMGGVQSFTRGFSRVFAGQPTLFMVSVMLLLLVIGFFLEPGAAIVLFVPLLTPVARTMGIDHLQFSMVMILTLTIGLITPPVGVCLFVAARIGNISVGKLTMRVIPFLVAEVGVIVLLILFPMLSSGLPNLFH